MYRALAYSMFKVFVSPAMKVKTSHLLRSIIHICSWHVIRLFILNLQVNILRGNNLTSGEKKNYLHGTHVELNYVSVTCSHVYKKTTTTTEL